MSVRSNRIAVDANLRDSLRQNIDAGFKLLGLSSVKGGNRGNAIPSYAMEFSVFT